MAFPMKLPQGLESRAQVSGSGSFTLAVNETETVRRGATRA